MKNLLQRLRGCINKDLVFVALNQLWRLISGPLTLVFVPLFLSAELQGFWFTFSSISALAVFADLGFSNIVMQFAAHEFARLRFNPDYSVAGDELSLKHLASFFRFTVKWVSLLTVIAFPIILCVGIWLFSAKQAPVNWLLPWLFYVIGSALSFYNNAILSFIEGCNSVAVVQRIRFQVAIVNTVLVLALLYFHFNLYALAIAILVSSAGIFLYFIKTFGRFIRQLWNTTRDYRHSWRNDFLKLFWKYALSFASGYLIFQIYTPLIFIYHGPVAAGRVGISIAFWFAVFNIAYTWIYAIIPRLNMLVAQAKWLELDQLFRRNQLLALGTYIIEAAVAIALLMAFKGRLHIVDRFLDLFSMAVLAVSMLIQLYLHSIAIYLRAHKEEPLVWPTVAAGIYVFGTTLVCAIFLPLQYFFLGLFTQYIWLIPLASLIFVRKKEAWHRVAG
jgi:hypothetical protein